jgi:hypothetical protein
MTNTLQSSRSTPLWIAAAVLAWLTAVLLASATGWLGSLSPLAPPPIAALTMIVPIAVYLAVPALRAYIESIGLRRLTAIHVLRIAAAPLFFWYGAHHLLPQLFVDRAAWGDIAAGLLALLAVTLWQRPSGYWLAHLFGMADFFVAFGTAMALTRQHAAAMHAVTGLPMALIPFFGVGFLATTHVMAYHLLLRQPASLDPRSRGASRLERVHEVGRVPHVRRD